MMKKINKKIALIFVSAIISTTVFAQTVNVKDMVPTEYYDELMKDGYVIRHRSDKSNKFNLLPKTHYSSSIEDRAVIKEEKTYSFTYEGLYYLPKTEILKESNSSKKEITIDDISKVCRSVSKMEGMEYYSHRRKGYRVLYDEAYMIAEEDLDERKPDPIPDQNTGNADGQVSYCLQKDSSFGRNKYKLSYFQNENELFTEFSIMDTMGVGPFNAIYPERLKIFLLVVDCGDDLLLYFCTDADAKKFPGIEDTIEDSMTARMEAVYSWFKKQF